MDVMERRRKLIASQKTLGGLPSEYQRVEYIESSGTQAIDTGYFPTTNTNIVLKKGVTSGNLYNFLFGAGSNSPDQLGINVYKFNYFQYVNQEVNTNNIETIEIQNGILYFDGDVIYDFSDRTSSIPTISASLVIFARSISNSSTYERYSSMKLYEFKIWEGSTLVRNMIPCYRKFDNEIGLYDMVTKEFFTNIGTGTFAKGNDIRGK